MEEKQKSAQPRVTTQSLQRQLTKKEYVAFLMREIIEREMGSQQPSRWLGTHPDIKEVTLQTVNGSHKYWAEQELEAFKQEGRKTPKEIREASAELTQEAYGARIVMAKENRQPLQRWLGLPAENRQSALQAFDKAHEKWRTAEIIKYKSQKIWAAKRPRQKAQRSPAKSKPGLER